MPRLSRVRLVSVGHPNARFEDVTLDLRDAQGDATDSVLWLRNGGGKSSLLNLIFAVIRTDRRDFLGGRAESRQRVLEDYILPTDRGVVVTEWELDDAWDALALGEKARFTAGVFYEHRQDQERSLRRLFFAGRVIDGVPETQLDGLPLSELRDEGRVRRTFQGFRELWAEQLLQSGDTLGIATETQREWYSALDAAGIDPDLFRYQLRMNLREGGADELFRFSSDADFVDFLLELTVDPSHSEDVGKNIEVFREQLRRRAQEYLPELDFCRGLAERLVPFAPLNDARERLGGESAAHSRRLAELLASLAALEATRVASLDAQEIEIKAHHANRATREERAQALRASRDTWLYHAAAKTVEELEAAETRAAAQAQASQREIAILSAAQHHLRATRAAGEAAAYAQERVQRHEALRPDKARADAAAHALARALDRLRAERRGELEAMQSERQALRTKLDALRGEEIEGAATMRAESARAERARSEAAALERQLAQLVDEGVIRSVDDAAAAAAALEAQAETLRAAQADASAAHARAREAADAAVVAVADARARQRAADERVDAVGSGLREADARWEALRQKPELRRRLEAESISREELLAPHATELFERAAAVLRQRALSARARRAELERDDESLRHSGFLAPEAVVERVLALLPVDVGARSGWQEISATSSDRADAERRIQAAPELARGVIVDASAFARTVELLAEVEVDAPVVIGTPEAWGEGVAAHRHVLTNINAARYDRAAAQRATGELEARARELDEEAAAADEALRSLLALLDELRMLRARFGAAWFEEQRGAEAAAIAQRDDAARDEAQAQQALDAARAEEARQREAQSAQDAQLAQLERRSARLELLGDAPRRLAGMHDEARDAAAASDDARKAVEGCAKTKIRLDMQREETELALDRLRGELQRLDNERNELGVLDSAAVEAAAVEAADEARSLDALRAQWRAARAIFEDAAGDDGLSQMERHAAEQAQLEAQRRDRAMAGLVSLEEVASRAEALGDPDRAEALLVDAREAANEQSAQRGALRSELERAQQELRAAEAKLPADASRTPDAEIERAEDARQEAMRVDEALDALRQQRHADEDALQALREAQLRLESQREALHQLSLRAQALRDLTEDSLPEDVEASAADYDAVKTQVEALATQLHAISDERSALQSQRQQLIREVRAWCNEPRFEELRGEVAQRFRRMEDAQLAADADAFAEELGVRVRQLDASVKELDQHRRTLAQLVLQLAMEGIRQLELAGSVSKIPEGVPEFGGERFLEIRAQVPQDPAWRAETVRQFLDELVTRNEIPSGIELVQLAVRRLAGDLRVRVLNPNPAANQRRIPVTETAKFSGGEQLTSAILLFCTLANVRARNRGLARQPSSVLILDNPIGRASRRRFVEMQLAFARAMNVQLVYTTAVNDAEALSVMPNIIRLTNQRVDVRRGHRLVEAPSEAHVGEVSSTRLTRIEGRRPPSERSPSALESEAEE